MSDIVPLRGLVEEDRTKKILELGDWLERLLSLNGEHSAERLEVLLPMIKKTAWGISITDIKRAFTLYVEGKMSIEPRDNYLTVILFSKVIEEFKRTNKKPEPKPELPEMTEQAKDEIMQKAIDRDSKEYLKTGMLSASAIGQYDWLDKKGSIQKRLNLDKDQWYDKKIDTYTSTKALLKAVYESERKIGTKTPDEVKTFVKSLENGKNGEVIAESKKSILKEYYETLK